MVMQRLMPQAPKPQVQSSYKPELSSVLVKNKTKLEEVENPQTTILLGFPLGKKKKKEKKESQMPWPSVGILGFVLFYH